MQNKSRPRALIRKLGQGGKAACGDGNLVAGGMAPAGEPKQGPQSPENAATGAGGAAGADGGGGGQEPTQRLAEASIEVLTALRGAKAELAKELEANLKQLKSVLEETQRIQRQMEAVLKETQCAPSLAEKATGKEGPPAEKKAARESKKQGEPAWQPEDVLEKAEPEKRSTPAVPAWGHLSLEEDPPSWEPPGFIERADDDTPPGWQPPPEADRLWEQH